ncbi:MAG: metallophosphoesterase, partial [Clostridia bacterium]|nr:metallophosphoesterase [Clostridia bacterium]
MNQQINELLSSKQSLRFSADGTFRIMMFSDIHGGRGFAAKETHDAIEALVADAKPDLVLIGGDICGPGIIHAETEDDVRFVLDAISEPMEKRGIPWAHV